MTAPVLEFAPVESDALAPTSVARAALPGALPWHEEAEQSVLGAVLYDVDALDTARAAGLREEHFYQEAHRAVFRAFVALRAEGEAPDLLTLAEALTVSGELARCGGREYLAYLAAAVFNAARIAHHTAVVVEYAQRRALVRLADRLATDARAGTVKAQAAAQSAAAELVGVAAASTTGGFKHVGEYLWPLLEEIERRANGEAPPGVRTGYAAIDEGLGGFRPGDLVILAGVPGSGKTALALNIALNAAVELGHESAFVSAEMTSKGLTERCLGNLGLVESSRLRKGTLEPEDWARLTRAAGVLKHAPLHLDDTPRPHIGEVAARLRALKTLHPGLELVVVDFLQLLRGDDDMMALLLTNISYDLKGLAKELGLVVIATCQVDAAAVEKSEEPRPKLHHLRWSQGMREAADFAATVYRPRVYNPMAPDNLEVAFEKARDLANFVATLRWVGRYMRAENHPDFMPAVAA